MNNIDTSKWYFSTWFIIVMFICFWPAGIALLILKNTGRKDALFIGTTDKRKYVLGGVALLVIGLSTISDHTFWGLLMIVGGAAMFYYSKNLADKADRNRKYIDLIVNQHEGSIDNIAGVCNIAYDKCVKELKYLQTVGVLSNVSIDETGRTVNLIQTQPQAERNVSILPPFAQAEEVTCTCQGCGAKVVVAKGTTVKCEYCDSPISAN